MGKTCVAGLGERERGRIRVSKGMKRRDIGREGGVDRESERFVLLVIEMSGGSKG